MKKRFLLLPFLVCLCALSSYANLDKIRVHTAEGVKEIYIKEIKRITFDENRMLVETEEGVDVYDAADVDKVSFDVTADVEGVESRVFDDGVSISIDHGVLTLQSADGSVINLNVYSTAGVLVKSASAQGTLKTSLLDLPKGVYIAFANGKTLKFTNNSY